MNCPHCRTALPEEASFCMSCGKPVPAVSAGAAERRPGPSPRSEWPAEIALSSPEADSRSRTGLFFLVLIAILLAFGIALWLLSRSRGAPVASVPPAPAPRGPSVVQTPATSGPPVTAQPPGTPQPPPQPQGMPEDIRRYLAFLQGVEAQRKQYEARLTNQMLAIVPNLMMPNFDENSQPPDQQLVRQYDQTAQQYSQATVRFQTAAQQVTVPQACRKLHAYYSTALSLNPRLIMETARRLAGGDYAGLLQMRASIGKTIEENYRAADDELAHLCEQYRVRKPFDIGNTGSGNSILLPGL